MEKRFVFYPVGKETSIEKRIFFSFKQIILFNFFFKNPTKLEIKKLKEKFNQNHEVGVKKRSFVFCKNKKKIKEMVLLYS